MDFSEDAGERNRQREAAKDSPWNGLSPYYVRATAAQRLRVLGHPDRLRIVEMLARRSAHVGDIAAHLGLPLRTASRHVRALHAAGIVAASKDGTRVLYVLTDREVPRLAAFAYRSAAAQGRRMIAAAPDRSSAGASSEPSDG